MFSPSCFQENKESPPPQSPPFPGVSPSPEASCLPAVHCGWVSCPLTSPLSSPRGSLCHPTFSICSPISPRTSESPEPTHPLGPPPWPRLPALPGGLHGGRHPGLTAASPRGYLYAGREFGAECYCGHKIQAANVSEAECDMDCKGERGSVCGGANRLSVYRLQLVQESARRCT